MTGQNANDLDMFKVKIITCILHTPPRPKFLSVSLYDEPFLSYRPIFGKVHQMTLTCSRSKIPTYTPEAQIFVRFALWWAVFELRPNFWKSAPNDSKSPWHVHGHKYQHACYIHIRDPNFRLFHFMMSHFSVTAQFWEKCTEWPQMTMTCSRSKIPNACYIHPQGPNFRPFHSTMSRFWVTAQFGKKCTQWPQMTFTGSRSKIPTCMLYTPLRPKFSSVSLYD